MAKLVRRHAEGVALWGVFVHIIFAGVTFGLAWWNRTASSFVIAWLLAAGVPFWLLCFLHMRRERLAEQEEADWERLLEERRTAGGRGEFFEVQEGEAFEMRNKLRSLEKLWLPVSSILLTLAIGALCFLLFRWLLPYRGRLAPPENRLLSAGFLGVALFLLFLLAMYASGMSRENVWRRLRAGASYMMFCAAGLALVIVALLAGWKGYWQVDLVVSCTLAGAMGLLAFELLLNFVVNVYRPRMAGVEVRYAYDSRLLELLSHPSGVLRTLASTLDYQFGFKVSETWFYRFMERAVAPIILFMVVTFYLLTCFVIVGPQEKAIVERFGRASEGGRILRPGLHMKWPWPIERVYRYPAMRVNRFVLGYEKELDVEKRLWTVQHFVGEHNMLVATEQQPEVREVMLGEERHAPPPPVNLLACNVIVHHKVKDDDRELFNYAYGVTDPEELLKAIAYREVTKYMASVDFFRVMCVEREKAGRILRDRIQEAADAERLGLQLVFVGFQGVHPPVEQEVGKTFEDVVAAQQEKLAVILRAEAYAVEKSNLAKYEAKLQVARALGYRYQRAVIAQAEAQRFESQLTAYRAAPGVFEIRELLDNLEPAIKGIRKYIVAAKDWDVAVIDMNLQEATRPGLLDVKVGKEQESSEKGSEKK